MHFENIGWSRLDYSDKTLDRIGEELRRSGIPVEDYDVNAIIKPFFKYLEQPAYKGEYRIYGGDSRHCLLEKALEHFISLEIINPKKGMVGIDIGSCKSVVPEILRKQFAAKVYEQDLSYFPGVHRNRIGSNAANIPLPDSSVDFMMLHCTFEHFENQADTGFVQECSRLLKPGGRAVILPLYLNANYCNITGERDEKVRQTIGFDEEANFYCYIPSWQNRFGRHYSVQALVDRVLDPARSLGLKTSLIRCHNWEVFDPRLWLRWILVLTPAQPKKNKHSL